MKVCRVIQCLALLLFGLMAGFFFAFSVAVVPGLDRTDPVTAIKAMNAINDAVRNPVFFFTFFATPIIACVAAALGLVQGRKPLAWLMGSAAVFYLVGIVVPTATVNVPMNQALALYETDCSGGPAATVWLQYSSVWTGWNTLRACISTACLALTALSLTPRAHRSHPNSKQD